MFCQSSQERVKPVLVVNSAATTHADRDKPTLIESLICEAGNTSLKAAGDARMMNARADGQERGTMTMCIGVSQNFEHEGTHYGPCTACS